MKHTTRKLPVLLLAVLLITSSLSISCEAAVKVLKPQEYTTSTEAASKAAKKVKNGSYKVCFTEGGNGYLKYTAAKNQKVTFNFSKLTTKYKYDCGHIYLMTATGKDGALLQNKTVRTQGGKATSIYLATQKDTSGNKTIRHLTSRYAKFTLKKGQTVFIYFSFMKGDTLRMKITGSK